jgi:hypothetical protein
MKYRTDWGMNSEVGIQQNKLRRLQINEVETGLCICYARYVSALGHSQRKSNSTDLSPSWESDSRSSSQEISNLPLYSLHYSQERVDCPFTELHESSSHNFTHFFKIRLNSIPPSTLRFSKCCLSGLMRAHVCIPQLSRRPVHVNLCDFIAPNNLESHILMLHAGQ